MKALYRALLPLPARARIAAWRHRLRHWSDRNEPDYRRSQAALGAIRDSHRGETCFILGNGPSMRGFDLSRLAGTPAFCLNRGYLLWNEQGLAPDFLVAVNDLVIEQFSGELLAVEARKFVPWLHHSRFPARREDLVYFEPRWEETFSTDARQGLAPSATVTNAALQLAYHMGFRTVILLGIDHRFAAAGTPHRAVTQQTDDPNHFRPDYFGPGTRWNLPDLEASARGYRLARRAFEADGRRILNATPATGLDVFETVSLEDVLDGRLPRHQV